MTPPTHEQLIAEARIWRGVHLGSPMTVYDGTPLAETLEQAADALAAALQRIHEFDTEAQGLQRAWTQQVTVLQQRIQDLEQERNTLRASHERP